MANIEAIIIDGVRYNRVEAETSQGCQECHLKELCDEPNGFGDICWQSTKLGECWKRKE